MAPSAGRPLGCFASQKQRRARDMYHATPLQSLACIACRSITVPACSTGATWAPCLRALRRGAGCERPGAPGLIGGGRGSRSAHEPRQQRQRRARGPASRGAGRLGRRAAGQLLLCQRLVYMDALGDVAAGAYDIGHCWPCGHKAMRLTCLKLQ